MSAINEVDDEKKEPLEGNPKEEEGEISSSKIKLLYIGTVFGVLLVVVLVGIIVIFVGGSSKSNNSEQDIDKNKTNTNNTNDASPNPETDPNYDPFFYRNLTNYFSAKYELENEEIITLFNEKYLPSVSKMFFNDRKINVINTYNFSAGEHTIFVEFKKGLESTEEMFKDCKNLKGIFFTNFKTENITNMSLCFQVVLH